MQLSQVTPVPALSVRLMVQLDPGFWGEVVQWALVCGTKVGLVFCVLCCSEDRVIEHYKKLSGQSRGQAIVK